MNRKVKVVGLFLVGLVAVGFGMKRRAADDGALELAGTIEARSIRVGSLVGGRIAAVDATEGDVVEAGQLLVKLESDMLDAQLREQEARIAELRERLAVVRLGPRDEEIARLRAEHTQAEADRRRMESLAREGIVGRQQYDAAATVATSRLELLRERESGSRPEDIRASEAAVAQAEERLSYLQRQREETLVKAPRAGALLVLDVRPGDLVAANQPIAEILEEDQTWVRLYVPETKLGLVHVGQKVQLTVDSFPDRRFPGRVTAVSERAEYTPRNVQTLEQRVDQVFRVDVKVEGASELKAGMAVLATVPPAAATSPAGDARS